VYAACVAVAASLVVACGDATAAEGTGVEETSDAGFVSPRVGVILELDGSTSRGLAVYQGACEACHLASGRGVAEGGIGKDLAVWLGDHDDEAVVVAILGGRPGMPAFGGSLTDEQIADVVAWLRRVLVG